MSLPCASHKITQTWRWAMSSSYQMLFHTPPPAVLLSIRYVEPLMMSSTFFQHFAFLWRIHDSSFLDENKKAAPRLWKKIFHSSYSHQVCVNIHADTLKLIINRVCVSIIKLKYLTVELCAKAITPNNLFFTKCIHLQSNFKFIHNIYFGTVRETVVRLCWAHQYSRSAPEGSTGLDFSKSFRSSQCW